MVAEHGCPANNVRSPDVQLKIKVGDVSVTMKVARPHVEEISVLEMQIEMQTAETAWVLQVTVVESARVEPHNTVEIGKLTGAHTTTLC